ncbi:MAG: hypothetical protein K2Y21_01090 [Phycisphaerales bacterium]|nr:hypothetical protein [Phycisphaerales bacterium]
MRPICSLAMLGALTVASPALADSNNLAQVFISPSFSGGSGPFSKTVNQVGVLDIFGAATGGFNSSGHAALHVDYGTIRANGQALGSLNANVKGSFHDDIMITAPGVPTGTNGTLTFQVISSGTVAAASGSSASTWTVRGDVGGGATDLQRTGTQYSPDLAAGAYVGDPVGTYLATVSFQFGMTMPLSVELQCSAGAANSPGPVAGEAHYGTPFVARWGGITQVLIGSSPVPGFSVSSSSGTNWANPASAYCAGDLNSDGFVDDSDFVAFAAAYNTLDCSDPAMPAGCPADLNADGVVDDLDFVVFAAAYNELICP